MSSRVEQKNKAREARMKAEAEEAARNRRARRARVLISIVAVAALAVVLAVVLTGGSDKQQAVKPSGNDIAVMFEGIPSKGLEIGDPKAPVTVEEFVDLQCPFCGQFSREAFPHVLQDYVRTGKVKLILRPQAFIGPDSLTAASAVAAAAEQDLGWQFADVFYANQGNENSGYVTDSFLRDVGKQVPGLDVQKLMQDATTSEAAANTLSTSEARFKELGLSSTPSFALTKGNGKPQVIDVNAGDYLGTFRAAVDPYVNGSQN